MNATRSAICKFPRGSEWRKWDLHIHTPDSLVHNYRGSDPWDEFLTDLRDLPPEISVIGINDYIFIDGYRRVLEEQKRGNLPNIEAIFPVVELRLSRFAGSDGRLRRINWHVLFEPGIDASIIQGQFINGLSARYKLEPGQRLTWSGLVNRENLEDFGSRIRSSISQERLTEFGETNLLLGFNNLNVDLSEVRQLLQSPALVSRHMTAIGRAEWSSLQWNDQSVATKKDLINDADVVFTAAPTIDSYHKSRERLGRERVNDLLLDCSDAHTNLSNTVTLNRLGQTFTWINADPTMAGLSRALIEFDTRVYVGAEPPKLAAVRMNGADHIKSVALCPAGRDDDGREHDFFDTCLELNSGFVAVIGNKGRGKSALMDAVGLAANSYEQASFSFLCKQRFLNPKTRYGDSYKVSLEWCDGNPVTKLLGAPVGREEPENATYLPQRLLDEICSSDPGGPGDEFTIRLSNVLFAHVPHESRLGTTDLESLIRRRTAAMDEQLSSLRGELTGINAELARLVRRNRPERLNRLRSDLSDLERREQDLLSVKPTLAATPPSIADPTANRIREDVEKLRRSRDALGAEAESLRSEEATLSVQADAIDQVEVAVATLEGTLASFFAANTPRAQAAGVDLASIVKVEIDLTSVTAVKDRVSSRRRSIVEQLDPMIQGSVAARLGDTDKAIVDLEAALDEPARKFAESQQEIAKWESALQRIREGGDGHDGKSDIRAAIDELVALPDRIRALQGSRREKVAAIHRAMLSKIDVLNELYGPARAFIGRHELAVKSGLEFAATLGQDAMETRFWEIVNRSVSGPFFGQVEGSEKLRSMIEATAFDDTESVCVFTEDVCAAVGLRPSSSYDDPERCLRKGRTLEELYDLIFGLNYVEAFHLLRYKGVPIERLSPGEKGTLLLMFYLLIDPSSKPLLLDQPDENLDNETIKDLLAPAIKEASARRQVIIVTHNPNVAVVADADQVVVAAQEDGRFSYYAGSIECAEMNQYVVDVLEGTWPAFGNRERKYQRPEE